MAQNLTIARPYARALFNQAQESQQLDQWQEVLEVLSVTAEDKSFADIVKNPIIEPSALISLLGEIVKAALPTIFPALSEQIKNFITLLVDKDRIQFLPQINDIYKKKLAEAKNVIDFEVVSAKPLDDQLQSKFFTALEKRFSSKVNIDFKVDPALIGGAVVRSGNWVMDGSIEGKLSRLKYVLAE